MLAKLDPMIPSRLMISGEDIADCHRVGDGNDAIVNGHRFLKENDRQTHLRAEISTMSTSESIYR
jgi:hypothetical protein